MTSPTSSQPAGDPLLLAVATSAPRGSLALASHGRLLARVGWEKKAMHSELATVKLHELLESAGRTLTDLTHVAVIHGPGSFTGIRIGVTLARTLAYGLDLPVAGVNALSVLARKNLRPGETGVVAIKAIRDFFYAATFENRGGTCFETHPTVSLTRVELAGKASATAKLLVEGETPGFDAEADAADLVHGLAGEAATFLPWKELKPLYIRGSEAEEKLRQGLLKPV